MRTWMRLSRVLVIGGVVAVTACASTEDVESGAGALGGQSLSCNEPPRIGSQWTGPGRTANGDPISVKTLPIHREFHDKNGEPFDFECYGGCGPGGELMQRAERTFTVCKPACADASGPDEKLYYRLTYREVRGAAHPFCDWHDACYMKCAEGFGGARDTPEYTSCTRWCDAGCINPSTFNASRKAGAPREGATNSKSPAIELALRYLTGDEADEQRSIRATASIGAIPDADWSVADCALWALPEFIGVNAATDTLASQTGIAVFTELLEVSDLVSSCETSDPAPPECGDACPTND